MQYRPEIDGLRAVAVLSVLFFHAKLPVFSGGFLGVDVFFVISGYLIGSILLSDLARDTFSFRTFYERRARRILPALYAVIFCSLIAAWVLMTPVNATAFYKSALAAVASVSNIFFLLQADYFDSSADLKPLLHTWSLGVEEQFYIVFPVLLFLVWRYMRAYLGWVLLAGFAGSLAVAEVLLLTNHPKANFYLLPSRGWELLAGAYLAYLESKGLSRIREKYAAAASLAGLAMILLSFVLMTEKTPHPGLLTLFPVAGTALVIYFGRASGIVKTILSHRVPVLLGLMSYSVYLWHYPLFAFSRFYMPGPLSAPLYGGLILCSLGIGYLSYCYIEAPFRNRGRISARPVWVFSGAGAGVLAAVCAVIVAKDAFPARFAAEFRPAIAAQTSRSEERLLVGGAPCNQREAQDACVIGDTTRPPAWVVIGDSHAGTIGMSMDGALKQHKTSALFYAQNGCSYLIGAQFDDDRRSRCAPYIAEVEKRLRGDDLRKIVIMNRYQTVHKAQEKEAAYRQIVEDLLARGKEVYLVYPTPEYPFNVPDQIFKTQLRGDDTLVTSSYAEYLEKNKGIIAAYDSLGERKSLRRIYPAKILCNTDLPGRCVTEIDGKVMYADDNHLSVEGADLLVRQIFSP